MVLEGETGTYTVRLHARPESDVTVDITGHENTAISISPGTLTFTPGDWNVPKTVEITAAQDDNETDEDAVNLVHSSPEEEYENVPEMTVSVSVQDDDRPAVITSRTAITLLEGNKNTYGVRLSVQPEQGSTAIVTIAVPWIWENAGVVTSPRAMSFTSDNWDTPQEVTVTGPAFGTNHAPREIIIIHRAEGKVDLTTTEQKEYGGAGAAVQVTIVPTHQGQVTLHVGAADTAQDLSVPEGADAVYRVALSARPTGETVVTSTVEPGEHKVTISQGAALLFNQDNWSVPQTVTVAAGRSPGTMHSGPVKIMHTATGGNYDTETVPDVTVRVLDAGEGITLRPRSLHLSEGNTGEYRITLASRPAGTVKVTVAVTAPGPDGQETAVSTKSVTFNPTTWNRPQTVTVTTRSDNEKRGTRSARIVHGIDDPSYGQHSAGVNVIIYDDGFPPKRPVRPTSTEDARRNNRRPRHPDHQGRRAGFLRVPAGAHPGVLGGRHRAGPGPLGSERVPAGDPVRRRTGGPQGNRHPDNAVQR